MNFNHLKNQPLCKTSTSKMTLTNRNTLFTCYIGNNGMWLMWCTRWNIEFNTILQQLHFICVYMFWWFKLVSMTWMQFPIDLPCNIASANANLALLWRCSIVSVFNTAHRVRMFASSSVNCCHLSTLSNCSNGWLCKLIEMRIEKDTRPRTYFLHISVVTFWASECKMLCY